MESREGLLASRPRGGSLEARLNKPRAEFSVDDLLAFVEEEGLRLVSLMHIGGDGTLKTLDFVPQGREHLRDILEGGERCDGSSIFPGSGIRVGASDIVLRPRVSSAFVDPFSPLPTLAVLCGHVGRDGSPLPESPDTILSRAHERLVRETGGELWGLGEVEYFLGRRRTEEDVYGGDDRGYHASSPFVFGEPLRRRAMALLAEMGIGVKYGHSEVGYIPASEVEDTIWEQHEIELALAPLPRAAEAIVLTAWVLRNLAHASRMRLSLAPIMRKGHAGSGLHVHLSPVHEGHHVAVPAEDDALPAPARWLIGGLARLGSALMAFGNADEGSFVRLGQGKEAPNTVTWGRYNRHALIRLPIQASAESGRVVSTPTIEFRLADGSAHPYLLLAGIGQAMCHGRGLEGLERLLAETRAGDATREALAVPRSFGEIADALEQQREALEAGGVFPPGLVDANVAALRERARRLAGS